MRTQVKKACISTIAAAAAVALTAGMTGPAVAAGERQASSAAEGTSSFRGAGKTEHRITLITGDRITVGAKGRVTGIQPAKGREGIPVQTRVIDGHTHVIPLDAQRLIAEGKLDRRLFDVTELSRAESRKAYRDGLKVIVGYSGAARAAKAEVRAAGDTQVRRTLPSLNADAVLTPESGTTELWEALTRSDGASARSTAAGISHVWLDGVRRANLDTSVGQIGAPKAWAAKLTGKGVKIAVLDTGVDGTHADLKGKVVGAENFTSSPDTKDRVGHGTHVASIAAGTGAKSGGKYKGVAPDAELLNGKVLDDGGSGDDSGIIAGIDWAVAQGADVINLSLGGYDGPELDPLEIHLNKVTAEKGVLFAVSAGNSGPDAGTIGSPGSAESALTVGAVDDKDKIAEFSSVGPRVGDGGIKPDVTAPGVDITAASAPGSLIAQEVGEKPAGYFSISGTSMAAPHAAGAAALLKEQHKDWKADRLKSVLASSTKGGAYSAFQQGSGRIAVDKAIEQTVIAESGSISFGVQQWPHTDDKPVTEQVVYRNLTDKPVTLDLTATTVGPKGKPAPAGFFTLGQKKITVPANGTAAVDVTADTRIGGNANGHYSATVIATTADGRTVRTAAAVDREVESYTVTVKHVGRDGSPSGAFYTDLITRSNVPNGYYFLNDPSGTSTARIPKGDYLVSSGGAADPDDYGKGFDLLVQPRLKVDKDVTVTVDARTTKPASITVPDAKAEVNSATADFMVKDKNSWYSMGWSLDSFKNFRTAHIGPEVNDGSFSHAWGGSWTKGSTDYHVVDGGKTKKFPTGYTRNYKASELATVKAGLGASASSTKQADLQVYGFAEESNSASTRIIPRKAPSTRTLYLSTARSQWDMYYQQVSGVDSDGWLISDAGYEFDDLKTYKAGKKYTETFNSAVFSPAVGKGYGVFREGNKITGYLPVFADGAGHSGSSDFTSVKTTLHKGKTKVGENKDPLFGETPFTVGAADAQYTLKTSVSRSAKVAKAGSRIDASWTFRSKKPAAGKTAELAVSTARFGAKVGLDGTVAAGATQSVPVTVQGAAAGKNLKSLSVEVSYDNGKTWKKLTVKKGEVSVKNPAKGKAVSFKAAIADKKGNKGTVTLFNAYYGK